MMDKIKQWLYYFIIGIISMIALTFLPMIGSSVGLSWNIPNTVVGWIVWLSLKVIVAALNVMIFYSFMQQAKINIKDNPKYKEALEILGKIKIKQYIPRSPEKWNSQQYRKKGTTIFISTALATIALTQAILSFDWVAMLTYLFTIIMGLIFGVLQMKSAEEYWTDEFYKYAIMVRDQHEEQTEKTMEMDEKKHIEQGDDSICCDSRSDILVSSNSDSNISNDYQPFFLGSVFSNNSILGGTIDTCSTTTTISSSSPKETSEKGESKK